MTLAACLIEGARGGRAGGRGDRASSLARDDRAAGGRRNLRGHARSGMSPAAQKAFVDFQNDVTADDVALAEREGLSLGRASQALHHARHGDRPGQALANVNGLAMMAALTGRAIAGRPGRRRYRPPYIAGRDRRIRGPPPRQAFPADAAHAVASMGARARRGVCRDRRLVARAVFSARRRAGLARDRRPRGDARCALPSASAMSRRWARSTCRVRRRRFPRSPVHQHVLHLAGRTRALRRDVARRRIRARRRNDVAPGRRSLFHDHDDGECGARVPAHAVLPSGAVAGTRRAVRLGDRPVGAVLGRRPASRATCWRRWSIRRSISAMPLSPIMASPSSRSATASPARLYRISFSGELAYEIGVPARYGEALARILMQAGAAVRHRAVRHRGARCDAHREGSRRRQRDRRTHHRARSRASAA